MNEINKVIKSIKDKILTKFNKKSKKDILEKSNCENAYSWMWEFSKKVVIAIFLIYIFNYFVCWIASFLSGVKGWQIPYIDIFITSTNETTQIVLGGYFIKAMAENIIKAKNNVINDNNIINEDESLTDNSDDDSSF